MFVHSFALAGALTAIWMRTKKQKLKTLTPPAILSAIFGVTEPGMYGIALPLKKPFIFTLIASGIGGALLGLFGTVGYAMGGLGIFQLPSFIQPKEGINVAFIGALIAAAVGTVLAFVLTYFFSGANKETEEPAPQAEDNTKQNVTSKVIESPLNGEVIKLADISDSAFASGALGKGVAIKPSEGKLISPLAGTVSALFDTQHAIGIVTEHGAELLVHIGMDTVQLEGKFFNAHVAQGDKIEKGQLLIEFDIEAIEKAGYDIFTPVVITNFDQYTSIETAEEGKIQVGKPIIFLDK